MRGKLIAVCRNNYSNPLWQDATYKYKSKRVANDAIFRARSSLRNMNAVVCAVTIVYCVHGVEVRDAQSERIWSNRADLHKSASDYEISDAENLAHSSALGRYSPNFRNSRLNLHGRRAPDFRPAINSRLNKGNANSNE